MYCLKQCIKEISTPDILACAADTSLAEAARRMLLAGCGSIVVQDEAGRPLGIWTEADALALDRLDGVVGMRPVGGAMSTPLVVLPHNLPVNEAVVLFRERGIRHALVEQAGEMCGVVSLTDIVLSQGSESFLSVRRVVADRAAPLCLLGAQGSPEEALALMRRQGATALAVSFDNGDYGILTLRDLLRLLAEGRAPATLAEACSWPLLGVREGSSLLQARQLILQHKIRHLAVYDADGRLLQLLGFRDIIQLVEQEFLQELHSALRERDDALLHSRRSLLLADKVFESTLEGILITDGNGVIQMVNPAFSRITGYSSQEALGRTPALLKSGRQPADFYQKLWQSLKENGVWQGEVVNRRKGGLLYTEHLSITAIRDADGECLHYVAVFSDITQRKQSEERLHFLANHDALTGLPNRTLFLERLQEAIERAQPTRAQFALLFVDLDRFKLVNDTLGHHAGDELLVRIASVLLQYAPPHSTVARLSGDEFILLLPVVERVTQVAALAQQLLDGVTEQSGLTGHELFISASIGISMYPEDGVSADALLVNADSAMYQAKERGKNNFQFYTSDMNARAMERLKLEYSLHRALAQEELEVWYQPKVELATRRVVGAEALLRWRHPELGLMAPAKFIPIAEDGSLMVPMGEWVLDTACRDWAQWHAMGLEPGRIAVNVSGRQLKYGSFADTVACTLRRHGLDSGELELEITESVAMDEDSGMVEALQRLRELGVYLSIDDFGTGYSSLSYLKRLPVKGLKIDRSFIMDLHHDGDDAAITSAIISIGRSLGLELVAEGVELESQRDFLLRQGCRLGQGYLFSKPLPRAEFEALLAARM
ncbi:EAL domain-containing protein [Chromobacterium haemolyticum]|uniref:EAL domain-containing protein n=1 Tax=Chromobacterium fluminis TaxID=3044269 RepID=A0ABX0L4L1_9NEIS|nr:EAL domain-containing protein [Chromobacterium haemolyticum]NHR05971.1 EAL domain-containing protein [Chromobacterium haemolyticum]OQS31944.1 diguanylate cyclase [Chromobacterium haemolyticum]